MDFIGWRGEVCVSLETNMSHQLKKVQCNLWTITSHIGGKGLSPYMASLLDYWEPFLFEEKIVNKKNVATSFFISMSHSNNLYFLSIVLVCCLSGRKLLPSIYCRCHEGIGREKSHWGEWGCMCHYRS